MLSSILYATTAKVTGGRDGRAATEDGALDVKLATPKELGGAGMLGTNPEQLFAAGYAACFVGAMRFVASKGGPKVPDGVNIASTVGIGPRAEGGFEITVEMKIALPGLSEADARSLIEQAHEVCPYSNATRGNVDVKLALV